MSRTKLRVRELLALSLLAATLSGANAQEAPSAGPQSAASPAQPVDAAAHNQPTSATDGSQGDAGASSKASAQSTAGGTSSSATKPPPVCFKLTGHCVDGTKAPRAKSGTATTKGSSGNEKPLNLSAPDVRTVVSPDELQEPLPSNEQITETQEADTVSVAGDKNAPDVPGGFGALWWALNHPSQAWRILTPAE